MDNAWFSLLTANIVTPLAIVAVVLIGVLLDLRARKGVWRKLVVRTWIGVMVASGIVIFFAWRAFELQQPPEVTRTLAIDGFVTLILYIAAFPVIFRDYRKAETRAAALQLPDDKEDNDPNA